MWTWMKQMKIATLIVATSALLASVAMAQNIQRDYDNDSNDSDRDYSDQQASGARIDRYLDADVWVDRNDGEYYTGDNITISYRSSRDAFVAIYTVDTRGRVNLLFPANPSDDNFVSGGVTYSLPGRNDDYDLEVSGPEGREYIQIIASRERFPIPNWYGNSGVVCDWDDREAFLDDLNDRQFVRYPGQRFAYDRSVIFVNEWEPDYYRPVYWPTYPNWSVCGNVYIDYPYGGSVYINGIYWGCAPLYIPRVLVGWHTITIYDPYGYCWESDFHVSRYHTIVLNQHEIRPSNLTVSKYKEVRDVGYRPPQKAGYPNFKSKMTTDPYTSSATKSQLRADKSTRSNTTVLTDETPLPKKYARGSSSVIKTDRGYETVPQGNDSYSGSEGKKGAGSNGESGYRTNRNYSGSNYGKKTTNRGSSSDQTSVESSQGNGSNSGSNSGRKTTPGYSGGNSSEKSSVNVEKKATPKSGEVKPAQPPSQPDNGGYKKGNEGSSGAKSAPQSGAKSGSNGGGGKKRP